MKKLLLGIAFSATLLTGLAQADSSSVLDRAAKNAIAERIKPTGTVCVQGEECASASTTASSANATETTPAASASRTGKEIYDNTCSTCHASATASALGAPEFGNADDWQARVDQGFDTVLKHSIDGLNAMPARGTCADCSDDEMTLAIQYMVKEATGEDFGPSIDADSGDNEAATEETEEAADEASDAEEADAEEATEAEEEVAASEESTGRSGEEIYNNSCTTCHATGIAAAIGAPELGSNDDWKERLEQGFDTLLEHSINGLNAMPPKGTCGDCSDDEMKAVVQYMVDQLD